MKSPETNPTVIVQDVTPEPAPAEPDNGGLGQLPIAVSEGDFSTPAKRTRTITRPRGLRTLEQPMTPPPAGTPLAAETLPVTELLVPVETPPPVAEPSPLENEVPRHESSVVDEFLAAPPTPEPDVPETPGPDLIEPSYRPDGLLAEDASDTLNVVENPDAAAQLRRLALQGEPAEPIVELGAETLPIASETFPFGAVATTFSSDALVEPDPPRDIPVEDGDPSIVSHRQDSDARMVSDLLDQATAQMTAHSLASSTSGEILAPELVAPTVVTDDTSIAPEDRPDDLSVELTEHPPEVVESGLSPLAQTLAHMAEAMSGDLAIEEAVDLDIADAPLLPLVADDARPASPPPHTPPPRTAPPPLPAVPAVASAQAQPAPDARAATVSLPSLPEALAERPRRPKRSKPWFEEVFDESYLRTLPFMTAEQTLQEVDFIESSLGVPRGSEILDVACGYGRHAIELVQRGLAVTGLDLSLPLLIRAADESQRRGVSVNFVHTDMREMSFERQFSGAYCMLTSFGYFDEESNLKVAEGIARALKPGGRFLIDVVNRDYIVGDLPARIWWEGDGCVVLEEVDFNFNTNRILTHRSVVFEDGQQLEQEISIRVYSLHELGKLLRQAGFRVIEVSGSVPTRGHFFGANSRNLLLLAERRSD